MNNKKEDKFFVSHIPKVFFKRQITLIIFLNIKGKMTEDSDVQTHTHMPLESVRHGSLHLPIFFHIINVLFRR